ncbi:Rhodanese-like domain-containing protein [Syncephalastrum racemosum]|uniref:Rhodanese-like domain-containing protein n=1 Tax=Syncephalastrum racemosum TaxID=13706 RepID=A0A1X2HA52_SYNRA|nr:Rhodanese-like domain-containing protein [Syncephalastrum racemosum]
MLRHIGRLARATSSLHHQTPRASNFIKPYYPLRLANPALFVRHYSVNDKQDPKPFTVDFEKIHEIIRQNDKKYRLIDVREPNELMQGQIPMSKNLPLSAFTVAWDASPDDFLNTFNFDKPDKTDEIIVYCQAGIRSAKAADYLRQLGYSSVHNYPGSWADYFEKTSKL